MIKPSSVSFLITLILVAAVYTHGNEPVKDTDGNPVEIGELYYIQPVNTGVFTGGGLVPVPVTDSICPLGITQTILDYIPGVPVSFSPPSTPKNTIVQTSSDVVITFKSNGWMFCNSFPKIWKVDDSSSASKEPAILIAGDVGSENSWFKFEKDEENIYKLTIFTGTKFVGTIPGLFGSRQLVSTTDTAKTLQVMIIKKVNATATTTTSRVDKLRLRMFPFY